MLFNSRPVTQETQNPPKPKSSHQQSKYAAKSVRFNEWGTEENQYESSMRAETNFIPIDEETLLRSQKKMKEALKQQAEYP